MNVITALKKLTPKERAAFAVRLGVHERTIYRWATERAPIDPLKLPAIEAALKAKK